MPTRSATIAPKYTAAAGRRAAMMPGVDSERPRPFLLVDIDGVLSVYGVEACPEGYEELQLFADDPEPSLLCRAQWGAQPTDSGRPTTTSVCGASCLTSDQVAPGHCSKSKRLPHRLNQLLYRCVPLGGT
jgi:hypothetical protein